MSPVDLSEYTRLGTNSYIYGNTYKLTVNHLHNSTIGILNNYAKNSYPMLSVLQKMHALIQKLYITTRRWILVKEVTIQKEL